MLKIKKWDIYLSDRILPVYACAPFQSSDAGEYKCVATNDVGISEGVAMLTVRGRGRICCYNHYYVDYTLSCQLEVGAGFVVIVSRD